MAQRVDRRTWLTEATLAAGALVVGPTREASPATSTPTPGRLHLGIVTYNAARDWDLETILENVREAGLEGVEFRTTHAHGVEPSLGPARRREVRDRCKDAGLLQTSLGSVCEFQSPDSAVVQQNIETCREFVLLARDIGARAVKVRPNGLPEGVPVEKTLEQIGRALSECGRFAADAGVEIWMEVHGKGTQEPPHSQRIMEHCGHPSVGVPGTRTPPTSRTARCATRSLAWAATSGAATSTSCGAPTPTASSSRSSRLRVTTASRCARSRRASGRRTGRPSSSATAPSGRSCRDEQG